MARSESRVIGEAIIVRLVDFGEADRVATLLVRDLGRVSALARGARKSRKRHGGLALFARGEATLREGSGELWALEGFDVARGFPNLVVDVARVAQAAYACELTRELSPPHHAQPEVYDLLAEVLVLLDAGHADGALGPATLRIFELALLERLGLSPALEACVGCGRSASAEPAGPGAVDEEPWVLDLRRGGLVCPRCTSGHGPGERPLDPEAVRLLLLARGLSVRDGASLVAAHLPRAAWEAARDVLQDILRGHLSAPLRSVEFIGKLNAAGT